MRASCEFKGALIQFPMEVFGEMEELASKPKDREAKNIVGELEPVLPEVPSTGPGQTTVLVFFQGTRPLVFGGKVNAHLEAEVFPHATPGGKMPRVRSGKGGLKRGIVVKCREGNKDCFGRIHTKVGKSSE
jgi:hypothetical protein